MLSSVVPAASYCPLRINVFGKTGMQVILTREGEAVDVGGTAGG